MFFITRKPTALIVKLTALSGVAAILLTGCGEADRPPVDNGGMMGRPAQASSVGGPAITGDLSFEQLALASDVQTIKKNNVSYLQFKYEDLDGSIHKVSMPSNAAQGKYPAEEWLRMFRIYKVREQTKVRNEPKKEVDLSVPDFPFVSPRSQPGESDNTQSSQETSESSSGPEYIPPSSE